MEYFNKRILISSLNWGLGHATRCVPIIEKFIAQKNQLAIASDGAALHFLKNEFPDLPAFQIEPYNIRYVSRSSIRNMILLAPRIFRAIRKEHEQIKEIARHWKPDVLISDSRFGCYQKDIYSIIISHQIQIQSEFLPAEKLANKLNHYWINRFDECWIPDHQGTSALSGNLGHQKGVKNAKYIGPLSRFIKIDSIIKWDVLVVLSGPEPSRTELENLLIKELGLYVEQKILVVRGTKEIQLKNTPADHIKIVDWLQSEALNREMAKSAFVICRSGYSSIMDLDKMQKPALLIPTPGQTEQEYLAKYHESKGYHIALESRDSIKSILRDIFNG